MIVLAEHFIKSEHDGILRNHSNEVETEAVVQSSIPLVLYRSAEGLNKTWRSVIAPSVILLACTEYFVRVGDERSESLGCR